MARGDDGKRNFALRDATGNETSVFSGRTPRQAALKAARRLEAADTEHHAEHQELRLREEGTKKIHIYDGWAWEGQAPDDAPDWMPSEITQANVSKKGIEHLDTINDEVASGGGSPERFGGNQMGRPPNKRDRKSVSRKDTETHAAEKSGIPDEVREILEEEAEQNGNTFETLSDLTREEVSVLLENENESNITEYRQVYETAMDFYDQQMEIPQYTPEDILNLQRISKFAQNNDLKPLEEKADEHTEEYFENTKFDSEVISQAANPEEKLSIDEAKKRLENRIEKLSSATKKYELSDKETEQEIINQLSNQYLRILLKAI